MRVKNLFFYVLGILLIGAVVSSLIKLALQFLPIFMAIGFICVPLYGIYRTKHNTKGLRKILKKNQQNSRLQVKKKKDYTALFVTGFALSLIFGDLIVTFVEALMYSSVALFVYATGWEITRFLFKRLAKKNVLSFIQAVGLAL